MVNKDLFTRMFDDAAHGPVLSFKGADYLLVGEMDGFDLSVNSCTRMAGTSGNQVITKVGRRSWIVRSRVSLRLVDVNKGTWLGSEVLMFEEPFADDGDSESIVNKALQRIAKKISARILLSASGYPKVVSISPDNAVILNRGRRHGVEKGMIFEILTGAKSVKDPETGKEIDLKGLACGKLKIIQLNEASCVANFKGDAIPEIGDDTRIFIPQQDKIAKAASQRSIRVAIGGFHAISDIPLEQLIDPGLAKALEASVANSLNKQPGISVVEQNQGRIKKLMAQQMLTDLSKGREPGLPMGTLSGVDYLVFGNIVSLSVKKAVNPLNQMGVDMNGMLPYVGKLRAFIYLQDVNTGEHTLSEEITIEKSMNTSQDQKQSIQSLIDLLASEAGQKFLFGVRPLHIISVDLDHILLNHGREAGIKKGDMFEAFTLGKKQVDNYTGGIIEGVGSRLVSRIEVFDFSAQDYAMARLKHGQMPSKDLHLRQVKENSSPQVVLKDSNKSFSNQNIENKSRLVIGGIFYNPIVKKKIEQDLLDQSLSEMKSKLIERLLNDGGFVIADQNSNKLLLSSALN